LESIRFLSAFPSTRELFIVLLTIRRTLILFLPFVVCDRCTCRKYAHRTRGRQRRLLWASAKQ